jgi:hypothetical protein
MIIDNLDLLRSLLRPDETETKLIVDPDAVLSRTITAQRFEAIARSPRLDFQDSC